MVLRSVVLTRCASVSLLLVKFRGTEVFGVVATARMVTSIWVSFRGTGFSI